MTTTHHFCAPLKKSLYSRLALLWSIALIFASAPAVYAQAETLNVQPALLQFVKDHPNEKVQVIVQRNANQELSLQTLARAGSKKVRELSIINATVLELPAQAVETLAQTKGVRWISLDAPMQSAQITDGFGEEGFSTRLNLAELTDMALQSDGKAVVVGNLPNLVARYNSDRTLDSAFGSAGSIAINTGSGDKFISIALQADGKIVVAGNGPTTSYQAQEVVVVRYNTNGTIDTTFGSTGSVRTFADTALNAINQVVDMLVQSDGKVVVVGLAGNSQGCRISFIRYNSNGTLDSTFGKSGVAFITLKSC